jgi:hypothetical protein
MAKSFCFSGPTRRYKQGLVLEWFLSSLRGIKRQQLDYL